MSIYLTRSCSIGSVIVYFNLIIKQNDSLYERAYDLCRLFFIAFVMNFRISDLESLTRPSSKRMLLAILLQQDLIF